MKKFKIGSWILYSVAFLNSAYILLSLIPNKKEIPISFESPIINAEYAPKAEVLGINTTENQSDTKVYNLLLLGLDARRGDAKPRCDAIHVFSFSPANNELIITSIPRGTHIERDNLASQSAYIGNNCHTNGLIDTIEEIEKITELQIDAYATVGFSQALGILRSVNIPTTSTLQYLRNRRYAIGDNQRSHNQAVFLKDGLVNHFEDIYKLPHEVRQFLYKSVDTNLSYETFEYLIDKFNEQKIIHNPEKIILVTKPLKNKYVKEIHYEDIGYVNQENDSEFKQYQNEITTYLKKLILESETLLKSGKKSAAYNKLNVPFQQKLWLQIENESQRDELQYQLTKNFLNANENEILKDRILVDYRLELELFEKKDYLDKTNEWLDEYLIN